MARATVYETDYDTNTLRDAIRETNMMARMPSYQVVKIPETCVHHYCEEKPTRLVGYAGLCDTHYHQLIDGASMVKVGYSL